MRKLFLANLLIWATAWCVQAQYSDLYMSTTVKAAYDNGKRSYDGKPVAEYWQNTASYRINAELDVVSRVLKGSEVIVYDNQSTDTLNQIVVKLAQNVFKDVNARDWTVDKANLTDGVDITKLVVKGTEIDITNQELVRFRGTNMIIIMDSLPAPLNPGKKIELQIDWSYKVPIHSMRTGANTDSSFFMAYWYPQIAVYDNVYGWDKESYTGLQETYNDLNDYVVSIKVPNDYVVWATGDQANEAVMFDNKILGRIEDSRKSDKVISILDSATYASGTPLFKKNRPDTWDFIASKVPDFAWATSSYYHWDAASVVVDPATQRRTWANAVFPPDAKGFKSAAEVAAKSLAYLSTQTPGVPFPYNKHISYNASDGGGMEFPMIADNGDSKNMNSIIGVTAHEIAHTYFPFYVLTNERFAPWMDEGWVSYLGYKSHEAFGTKVTDLRWNNYKAYSYGGASTADVPLMTPAGSVAPASQGIYAYTKPALAYEYLVEMLEKDRNVENPLKQYITRWAGKHPIAYDFFFTMDDLAGENLSWYWKPWFFEFAYADLEIKDVISVPNKLVVTIDNIGKLPVPLALSIAYSDGTTKEVRYTAYIWKDNPDQIVLDIPISKSPVSITLGAPDVVDIHPQGHTKEIE